MEEVAGPVRLAGIGFVAHRFRGLTPACAIEERAQVQALLSKGKASARTLMHARILLKTDEGTEGPRLTDDEIAEAVEVNRSTVERVWIRCVEGGVDAALHRRPSRQVHARKLDGVQEAHLLALACKPWLKEQYCLPEAPSGEFVYHMQDVLDVYMRPYDPRRPLVCLDETSVQLVAETRTPLPMTPGQPARYDYAHERHGVAAVFMITEPLRGWREVAVGDQRTAIDFAHVIKHLVDVHFPDVERVVLVLDQLNVHTPGSLYEAFHPGKLSGWPAS